MTGRPRARGDRAGGLQGAGVGRDDDPLDPLSGQLLGGLLAPGRGRASVRRGIDDAGVAARGAEMQVELALAVAQQDHARAIQGRPRDSGGAGRLRIRRAPLIQQS